MYVVDRCVGCGSTDLDRQPAVVAPFIATYVLGGDYGRSPNLCLCHRCDLAFYDHRLDRQEIQRLYREYRSEAYRRARQRVEPFYTRRINGSIGENETTIERRRAIVGQFLSRATAQNPPASILDYGGDAGQFIPVLAGTSKRVYEISDVTPIDGVERVDDPTSSRSDLVMLAHVLEHASEPVELLRDEVALAATDRGWLYVEVPLDRPHEPPPYLRTMQRRYVRALAGPRRVLAADAVSTPLRVLRRGGWTPLTFPKMHEHLNHFSVASLQEVLNQAGWTPVDQMTYRSGSGLMSVPALGMVAART